MKWVMIFKVAVKPSGYKNRKRINQKGFGGLVLYISRLSVSLQILIFEDQKVTVKRSDHMP